MGTPAVADDMVYVGSYDYNFYALNATTGTQVWSYTTGGYLGTPSISNGTVYVGSRDHKLYAFGPLSAIPEFSPSLILPLFLTATLAVALVLKKRQNEGTYFSLASC